ncbi:hypothetical protein C9994_00350 [Marivirga lumbricoides]|uniref:Uncharacterized protein n=1 Tax=Marivirga lumbricoides TaxID=1046115 RepID=A0A2T4DW25_9BACT|nr:hypothetical protein C9994_00350 [Marivirga lumbricoides]
MTKKTKYIIGAATLILIISIFLPSRLTSHDLETIISFAKTDQIGYTPYILLLFPISFGLVLAQKLKLALITSTTLLLINTTLFENLLYFLLHNYDLTFLNALERAAPLLIYCTIFIWLIYKAVKINSWRWYSAFICLIVVSYIWLNDINCTIKFILDMGIKTYDLRIWFQNCGTYYAWWTAPILLNVGLFYEVKTLVNNGYEWDGE